MDRTIFTNTLIPLVFTIRTQAHIDGGIEGHAIKWYFLVLLGA